MNTLKFFQLILFLQVGTDNVRALYKQKLEMDNIEKFKKLKLEIEQLEYEKTVLK